MSASCKLSSTLWHNCLARWTVALVPDRYYQYIEAKETDARRHNRQPSFGDSLRRIIGDLKAAGLSSPK
jgi:hypothetical protein